MLRLLLLLVATFSFPWLAACGGGGGGGSTPTAKPALSWSLRSDRLDGVAGTPFSLQAVIASPTSGVSVLWDFGDGRQETGKAVVVSYPAPGTYTVRATAFGAAGDLGSSSLALLVFEATPTTIAGTDIPLLQLLGDVDNDGALTSLDVSLIEGHVAGAPILAAGARRAADYDFDGGIDAEDATLLTDAIAAGGQLPTRVSPASGPRTSMVRLHSRHLINLGALVEVRVGQSARMPIRRLHPGYGLFVVPMDAVGAPTLAPIAEGPVAVQLFVDGVVVDSVEFHLVNGPAIQGDEPAVFDAVATQLAMAAASLESSLTQNLQQFGASESDAQVVTAMVGYARSQFASAADSIGQIVAGMTPEQLDVFSFLCNANGLRSAEAALQSVQSAVLAAGFDGTGSTQVNVLYGLDSLLSVAEDLDRIIQVTCVASAGLAALSSLVTGPAGLLLAAEILSLCQSISIASDVIAIVSAALPRLANTVQIDVSPAGLFTWHARPYAPLKNAYLCGAAGSFLVLAVQDLVMKRITSRLTVMLSFEWLSSIPFNLRTGELRAWLVEFVGDALESVGNALDASGMFDAIGDLKESICDTLFGTDRIALRCSELESLSYSPLSDGWQLAAPVAGTFEPAVLTCDGAASGSVRIDASLPVYAGVVTTRFVGSATFVCDKLPIPGMVLIQPGTFLMGGDLYSIESPVHSVTISNPFWMGKFEIRQSEFQSVMGFNPSYFEGSGLPVHGVTWLQAVAYCDAISAQELAAGRLPMGYVYRLPTEAEWEYCCRAGTTTDFSFGNSLVCGQANFFDEKVCDCCLPDDIPPCMITLIPCRVAPVGSYPANPWGLCDMHGNVWEFCLDGWDGVTGYSAGPVSDPFTSGGMRKVVRGGGGASSIACRSCNRVFTLIDSGWMVGFRVVCAPVLPEPR